MLKWFKRFLLTLIIFPTTIVVVIVALYVICPVLNNIKADKLAATWAENIVLPDNTEIIEVISGCGNTSGTGNHTEVWAGILIKSDMSPEKVMAFWDSNILVVDENNIRTHAMYLLNEEFKYFDTASQYEGFYIIEKTGEAVSSGFDLRGH